MNMLSSDGLTDFLHHGVLLKVLPLLVHVELEEPVGVYLRVGDDQEPGQDVVHALSIAHICEERGQGSGVRGQEGTQVD